MIEAVVVGYGLAGRQFHAPLIQRQRELHWRGVVARDPEVRAQAQAATTAHGYASLDEALADRDVDLIVIATPHDSHAELTVRALEAGKHVVVDKVMALSEDEADRMIAARDASGRMLSVFHNRRWDWDYLTLGSVLASGAIGRPLLIESSVSRYAPPRTWRGRADQAGTILHDWGAHLIDQALRLGIGPCRRLACNIVEAPWPEVDSGGLGRLVLQFDDALFQVETSRITREERHRWHVLGTLGEYCKLGVDPQEDALRAGQLDQASEPSRHQGLIRAGEGRHEAPVPTVRGSWDAYYANIADHLLRGAPLAVTAEHGREVVRVLDAAVRAAAEHQIVEGPWGEDTTEEQAVA